MAGYLGLACASYLLVISAGRTKLSWYAVPLYPPMAVLIALAVERAAASLPTAWRRFRTAGVAMLAIAMAAAAAAGTLRHDRAVRADALRDAGYLLQPAVLYDAGVRTVAVTHPGFPGGAGRCPAPGTSRRSTSTRRHCRPTASACRRSARTRR